MGSSVPSFGSSSLGMPRRPSFLASRWTAMCLQGNLTVRNTHIFCHKKCGCAHNRRHDLAACGGSGFHSACKFRLIACLFHHRDSDRTGGYRVAYRRPGYHAAQSRGDNSNLSRPARRGARDGVCQIDEKGGYSGSFQKGTEDNKHDDVLGTDVNRGAHNACGGIEEVINDLAETNVRKRIDQQHTHHTENGDTDAAPAEFHIAEYGGYCHDNHLRVTCHTGGKFDDGVGIKSAVEKRKSTDYKQNDIIPGNVIGSNMFFTDGIIEVAEHQHQPEIKIQLLFRHHGAEQGYPDAIYRECRTEITDDFCRNSFPDAGVGFPVIFFHQLFCACRCGFRGFRCLCHSNRLLFCRILTGLKTMLPASGQDAG